MATWTSLTLKQIRALMAVHETGSITAAAQALNLTPPAIHLQIKNLESTLQAPLLQRSSDTAGSELTEAGRVLVRSGERIAVVLSQSVAEIAALQRGQRGRITLGVVSTGKYFAPFLVKKLKADLPDIDVDFRIGNRSEIIDDLDRHAIDLAIMGRPPRQPLVVADVLGPHPHGLVVAPDHPLAGKTGVTSADLADETFLAREEGSGTRILMTRYLDRIGEGRSFDLVEMNSNETIKQAVMAGLGIALISLDTTMDEIRAGRLVEVRAPGLPIMRQWFLVRPLDKAESPAAAVFRKAILALGGTFLPNAAGLSG